MNIEQEQFNDDPALWQLYFETKNSEYREALILKYLYLVKLVVSKMGVGFPLHVKTKDLFSYGVIGLIKAIEKYDVEKNSSFENYAILLIKWSIVDELRKFDWVPRSVHKKAQLVSSALDDLRQLLGRDPKDCEVYSYLGIKKTEWDILLDKIKPAILISLNQDSNDDSEDSSNFAEKIEDVNAKNGVKIAEKRESLAIISKAIDELSEKEKNVLFLYYYEDIILKNIGKKLGISESRVCQIHSQAILKLRSKLSDYLNKESFVL